ncbi:hypothetical protein HKD24_09155 [Gluconobacter sp. LMG 31484]|uniref:Uncharacterized protein n=1 Tax=Gluconobacter vitians TaxID=2728102 RepID=A0ABR9Y619_9PROT|nr:hypothetical protein [Gluconobacter vitians]MBF0859380.1 hypothetical protein [Gluconobacter vitians]
MTQTHPDHDDTDAMLNEMMARGREAQNSAVRTREEQIEALTSQFGEEGTFSYVDDRDAATRHILEAEARGAAEQRRKDAEEQEPFAYVSQIDANTPKSPQGLEQFGEYCDKKCDYFQVPLYTHPANVAALEARVKELEEAKLTFLRLVSRAQMCVPELYEGWHIDARAALKREGGV